MGHIPGRKEDSFTDEGRRVISVVRHVKPDGAVNGHTERDWGDQEGRSAIREHGPKQERPLSIRRQLIAMLVSGLREVSEGGEGYRVPVS